MWIRNHKILCLIYHEYFNEYKQNYQYAYEIYESV